MLKIAITIDTEFWPCVADWPDRPLTRPLHGLEVAYERDILGRTAEGDYGLPYLLQTLNSHGLHGVFFVESLSSSAVGGDFLRRTVRSVVDAGQEVQLHLHTEWLSEAAAPELPLKHRQNLGDFGLQEQAAIVRTGLENLHKAGAADVIALRAGNLGGSYDTPSAAWGAGLSLDMSFDPAKGPKTRSTLHSLHNGSGHHASACPTIPLSCVEDYWGHYRHAQLTAVSFGELRHALWAAARENWPCFVVLLHSFELVRPTGNRFGPLRRHGINVARWNKLCDFLASHGEVFRTVGCRELQADPASSRLSTPPRTRTMDTALRMGEQILSNFV